MCDQSWIILGEQENTLTIDVTHLLGEVMDNLKSKSTPKMILFIGDALASKLQECFEFQSSFWLNDKGVNLQLYPEAVSPHSQSQTKALLAHGPVAARIIGPNEHNSGKVIPWLKGNQKPHSLAAVYSRLLGPFFDVVCIILSSFPSLDDLIEFLSVWVLAHSSTSSDPGVIIRPGLVIIVDIESGPGVSSTAGIMKKQIENGILSKTGFSINRVFSDFQLQSLPTQAQFGRKQKYAKLRSFVFDRCLANRRIKTSEKRLFNPHNLTYLFNASYQCLIDGTVFNPISASRNDNVIPVEADKRIAEFLCHFSKDLPNLKNKALEFLLSAILRHAFPMGSHSKLD